MSITEATPHTKSSATRWVLVAATLLVMGLAVLVAWTLTQGRLPFGAPQFNGVLMQSPERVPDFEMMASTGERVRLSDFRGRPVLLYFGYTFCPDACPTTLSELKKVMVDLGPDADEVQVLMISVDPQRDTPEALRTYLASFDPSFIGLSGTEEEVLSAATPLGVYFSAHEGTAASGYLVDHTTTLMALDQDGYLRLLYPYETPAGAITADMRTLLR
jgi:protein SCO1/2